MKKNKKTPIHKGFTDAFTMIELLIVIAIIGILSSIITAALGSARARAVIAAGQTFEDQMYQAYGANAVAIWNFDEGSGTMAYDTSGNNNDLTLSSDPSVFWASTSDAFRGNSALSVAAGSSADVPAGTSDLSTFDPLNGSISFWVKLNSVSGNGIFCNNGSPDTFAQFCILDQGSTGNFIEADWNGGHPSNGLPQQVSTNIDPHSILGIWTQVAVSWNTLNATSTGTIIVYVNGKDVASSSNYYVPTDMPAPYAFCIAGDCREDNINGTLDAMRVYSQSLQTGDVEKIYAEELPEHVSGSLAERYNE